MSGRRALSRGAYIAVGALSVVLVAGALALLLSLAPGAFAIALMVAATVALVVVAVLARRTPPEGPGAPPA